jgi:hypothetical protein
MISKSETEQAANSVLKPNTTARRVLRLLADALQRRAVAPHIFESSDECCIWKPI